jgi:hypothetical protein
VLTPDLTEYVNLSRVYFLVCLQYKRHSLLDCYFERERRGCGCRCLVIFKIVSDNDEHLTTESETMKAGGTMSAEATVVLHGLYRRLLEKGEDRRMLRRAISVHPIETNVATAQRFLRRHRQIAELCSARRDLRFYQVLRRIRIGAQIRLHSAELFRMRLALLSWAALSDLLVLLLCASVLFVIYQMYRLCRVGLTRAEEKYQSMAIPIVQTIEALELTDQYRKGKTRRREMESDIVRERSR